MRFRSDRKSTRLNSSHLVISYAVFCLKKKKKQNITATKPSHDEVHTEHRSSAQSTPHCTVAKDVVAQLDSGTAHLSFLFFFFLKKGAPPEFPPFPPPAPLPI